MTEEKREIIVIGGEPAGSTAATRLAGAAHDVLLLEKAKFPREHVGESLLPFCYTLLDHPGAFDELKKRFVRKPGVRFLNKNGEISTTWCFRHLIDDPSYLSFQVARAEFDQVLLNNAARYGAEVREEVRVKDVDIATDPDSVTLIGVDANQTEKAFRREEHERDRFVRWSGQSVRVKIRLAVADGLFHLVIGSTVALGLALMLYVGGLHVRSGVITIGDLLIITIFLMRIFMPLQETVQRVAQLQTSLASAERVYGILDQQPEVTDRPDCRPLGRASGAVAFRNVSFAYDKDRPVLDDISFKIEPATTLGIAGRTGTGKSTLMNLLARFYDPTSGEILIDGVDIREYKLNDLRVQFATVLQDSVPFSTSLAENIAYGRPDASQEEIEQAARNANVHDFVASLAAGYQTVVGERGMTLSGGERRRIALPRAFLKDAPILILDEPTSSVDLITKAAIMEAIQRVMRGRTTFVIAHRVSTLKECDAVLNLDHGHIVSYEENFLNVAATT
jgi:ATP-binding cassette subfamily B protein